MTKTYEFRVMQDGMPVAGASGPNRNSAESTALKYAHGHLVDAEGGEVTLLQEKIKGRWKTKIRFIAEDDT